MQNKDLTCPYCNKFFETPPQRKKKCPHCKNDVYVKYKPNEKIKHLFTTEEAEEIDILWSLHYLREKVYQYGIKKEEFDQLVNEKKPKNRKEYYDFSWMILNKGVTNAMHKNDLYKLSTTYRDMAYQLKEEGKEFRDVLQKAFEVELRDMKNEGTKKVRIEYTEHCRNQNCRDLEGTKVSIQEAIEKKLIPCPGEDICSARYFSVWEDSTIDIKIVNTETKNNPGCISSILLFVVPLTFFSVFLLYLI